MSVYQKVNLVCVYLYGRNRPLALIPRRRVPSLFCRLLHLWKTICCTRTAIDDRLTLTRPQHSSNANLVLTRNYYALFCSIRSCEI